MPRVLVALALVLASAAPAAADAPYCYRPVKSERLDSIEQQIIRQKIAMAKQVVLPYDPRSIYAGQEANFHQARVTDADLWATRKAQEKRREQAILEQARTEASWWRWATPIISTATFLFGCACRTFRSYWREAVPPEPIDPRTRFAGVHSDPYF